MKQLSEVALEVGNLAIAERCCSALGDMPQSRFLHKVNKIVAQAEKAVSMEWATGQYAKPRSCAATFAMQSHLS